MDRDLESISCPQDPQIEGRDVKSSDCGSVKPQGPTDSKRVELRAVSIRAAKYVEQMTGLAPTLVGSLSMGMEIPGSDIDFVLSTTDKKRESIQNRLFEFAEFRGERWATNASKRHLYCITFEDVPVDINVMLETDAHLLIVGMETANKVMTAQEKSEYILEKSRKKAAGIRNV